ncbi:putative oxidoreductase [Natronocella acetinitrilica]|uniref:Oxidoreductase n=1 Tax=Natronocella acetinitrilica TaxID=414046 RepID=A0AAE3G9I3_9GAMM|nr:DoxX family protein [Natronocella acetinitrilica]MCP1676978.1 putative oxidoreductase [Natronocella acetinitrilica]
MSAPINTGDAALDRFGLHTHWLLRFLLASVFTYMGIDKFMGGGIAEFAGVVDLPVFVATMVALAEIGAGVFVVIGAFTSGWVTRLGAAMAVPVMLGAIVMAHWGQWHFMPTVTHPMGGMMFQVSLLLVAIYVLARGNEI